MRNLFECVKCELECYDDFKYVMQYGTLDRKFGFEQNTEGTGKWQGPGTYYVYTESKSVACDFWRIWYHVMSQNDFDKERNKQIKALLDL